MNHVSKGQVKWVDRKSPKGQYEASGLNYGAAMKAGEAGHPFEMMLLKVPPGQRPWPYHLHGAQYEFYYVLEGSGEMRLEGETVAFNEGDAMMCPPGEAHQLHNTGDRDLVVQIIASNQRADYCHYPDSDKWNLSGKVFRMDTTTYYDGEE